ncbi:MAG: translation initiation factor IF-3 [Treponema sp.]|nr:translation initiation factor IF-3 [Treponema sp.]
MNTCFKTRGGSLANTNNNKGLRINEQIRVREVRLIDDEGGQKGIVPTLDALKMAKDKELDLVEVSPNANPPVCKILDFGKYRFEMEKKLRDSKKNQKVLKIKEIRMQPKIGPGDLDTKAKHVQEFLDEGDKVKITIRFRGRELAHTDLGFGVLQEVLKRLTTAYAIEKPAVMDGKFMSMTISGKAKTNEVKSNAQNENKEVRS